MIQEKDVASGTDCNSQQVLVQAKEIPFFNGDGLGDGSSPSLSVTNKDDSLDDARSFEDQDLILGDNEEVAEFASEVDLNDPNVQLRGCTKKRENSDSSNRSSVNDEESV